MGTQPLSNVWLKYSLIFAVYLLCGWLVVPFGLDLTDTGYHLANQMSAVNLGLNYMGFLPVYWFSDILAGNLFHTLTLLQLRWVVIGMGALQLGLLLHLLRSQHLTLTWPLTIVTALLGAFMLTPLGFLLMIPDYYAIPTTVLYATTITLVTLLTKPSRWSIAAMVALTFLLLNLRFTTGLLIATLPAFIPLLQFLAFKTRPHLRPLLIFYIALTALVAAEALYITLTHASIWAEIAAAEWKNPKVHSLQSILHSYVSETLHQLTSLWPAALTFVLFAIIKRLKSSLLSPLSWNHLPYALLAPWLFSLIWHLPTVQSLTITSYVLGIGLILLQYVTNRSTLQQQSPFILAAMAMPIAIFAGSNTGIVKLAYGLPLLVAAILLLVHGLPARTRQHARPALMAFYTIALLFVVNSGLKHAYENVQITPTTALTYTLQNGNLRGIQTTPLSGPAIDETIAQILSRTSSADTIFTFPNIPLLHYATGRANTIPNIPNFDILQPLHAIATKVGSRLCLSPESTPKLLVFSRHYTFHPLWATNPQVVGSFPPTNDWGVQEATVAIVRIVEANCHPTILWQNEYFTLLTPHPTY